MKTLIVGMVALAFAAGCGKQVQARTPSPHAPIVAAAPDAVSAYEAGADARRARREKRYAERDEQNAAALKACVELATAAKQDPKKGCACVYAAIEAKEFANDTCDGYDPDKTAQDEADEDASYGAPSAAPAVAQGFYLGLVGPKPANYRRSSWVHISPDHVPGEQDGANRVPSCDGLEIALNGTLVLFATSSGPAARPMAIPVPTGMGVPLARGERNADMTSVLPAGMDGWVDMATMKVGAMLTAVAPPGRVVPSARCWERADRAVTAGGFAVPVTVWSLRAEMPNGGSYALGLRDAIPIEAMSFDWGGSTRATGPLAGL